MMALLAGGFLCTVAQERMDVKRLRERDRIWVVRCWDCSGSSTVNDHSGKSLNGCKGAVRLIAALIELVGAGGRREAYGPALSTGRRDASRRQWRRCRRHASGAAASATSGIK